MNSKISSRLQRIINNLRASTSFDERFSEPQTLSARLAKKNTPALSLAIIDDFEIAEVAAFGICKVGDPTPITEKTLFQAGSISKPVFATAVMSLVQQGKVDLDEDVNEYLKSWKIPANHGWQPRITLRQILSHTAGLTVHGFGGYLSTEAIPTLPDILNGENGANSGKVEANMIPGMQFRYSGGGTTVAQLAISDWLDETFPALMHRLVLQPLNMLNSTFENPLPSHLLPDAAIAHPWNGIPYQGDHSVYPEMAAAGLWTTPTDLATFGLTMQKALRGDDTNFLSKDTLETMLSPVLAQDHQSDNSYCGLGFFCSDKESNAFGHDGWDEGFVAQASFHKTLGKGAVVMINSNEGAPILGEMFRAIEEEFDWPRKSTDTEIVTLTNLSDYAGQYESELGHKFAIDAGEKTLFLVLPHQPPIEFSAQSATHFSTNAVNTKMVFELEDEAVVGLTANQGGGQLKAKKMSI